jgi:hypothetical protein
MFERSSRYFAVATTRHFAADGMPIVHKKRRFLPAPAAQAGDRLVRVAPGERLDTIAARTLGDPLQQWRIADRNGAMNPFELTPAGALLAVPAVGFRGRGQS